MNNEIKEILDKLQKVANRETASRNTLMEMKDKDYQLLLDYITNLQEELEITQEKWNKDKQFSNCRTMEMLDYKSRNEKAIEYIKQNSKCGGSFIDDKFIIEYIDEIFNGMKLLNILNGDDEE